jgi:hypothetical protein
MVSLGVAGALLASALAAAQTATRELKTPGLDPPAPPAPAPVAPAAVNVPAQVAQMTDQFRPYLRVEYHFLRTICALTPEQRTRIARAAEHEYRETVAHYLEVQRSPQLRRAGESPRVLPDPRKLIQEGLARAAEVHLSKDQAARYRDELAQRAEARKQAAIQTILVRLDDDFILSPQQHTEFARDLSAIWNEDWFPTEFMLMTADRYLYRIPRHHIVTLLNEDQRQLWELNAQNQTVTGVLQGVPSVPADFPEDQELTEARKAEDQDTEELP